MAKRSYYLNVLCSVCGETARHYKYDNRRDYLDAVVRANKQKDYCSRHYPDVLNITPVTKETELLYTITAEKSKILTLKDLFWRKNSDGDVSSGFDFGKGWNAYANDFPEGTRIEFVTKIKIVLP